MSSVRNEEIFKIVDKIRDHYHQNLNNRYMRKPLLLMKVPRGTWDALARLTEKTDFYKIQGYPYKELYEQIHAAATFVHHAKVEVMPRLRELLAGGTDTMFSRGKPGEDKILLDMAINNFPANLGVFSDLINALYVKAVEEDKKDHADVRPVYERMPELKELGRLLI
ncbi:MAG: hypothetical protein JSV89_14155 [Spirochaetaceae bacterium]|nr:MAG: hypothetical protein JSV89_14155 [Spirochaetaceae bacterium]